jgi:hypothetical protein
MVRAACLLLLVSFVGIFVAGQNVARLSPPADRNCASQPLPSLPASAEQVANTIGVAGAVQRLRTFGSGCTATLDELALRQQISDAVLTASLDIDSVLAEIDNERAQILEVRGHLSDKRDRKVNLLSLANIVAGTGSGIIGTAMQFKDSTAIAGDAVGLAGGSAGVILSIAGMKQQGGAAPLGVAPNMLAPLFNQRAELRSIYPADVWTYLNTAPLNDPRVHVPWREELMNRWMQSGVLGPPNTPASQAKIQLLTSRIGEQRRLPLDVLSDRGAMLLDLRARVSLMTRDLRDLMAAVAARPSTPR